MPLEAVTFDFHNTLAHCDAWFQHEVRSLTPEVIRRLAARAGQDADPGLLDRAVASYRSLRVSIIEHGNEVDAYGCARIVFDEIGVAVSDEAIVATIDEIMLECLPESAPVPGAVEAVSSLKREGVRLGVISAAVHHDFIEWSLAKFGILDAFDAVVSSASAGYYKTRPELYQHTLSALGADADASVHVGDSYRFDVEGARRAGMRTVWLNAGGNGNGAGAADLEVAGLTGLASLILERFGGR